MVVNVTIRSAKQGLIKCCFSISSLKRHFDKDLSVLPYVRSFGHNEFNLEFYVEFGRMYFNDVICFHASTIVLISNWLSNIFVNIFNNTWKFDHHIPEILRTAYSLRRVLILGGTDGERKTPSYKLIFFKLSSYRNTWRTPLRAQSRLDFLQ